MTVTAGWAGRVSGRYRVPSVGTPRSRTCGLGPLAELGTALNRLLSSWEGQARLAALSFPTSWGQLCHGQSGGRSCDQSWCFCSLNPPWGEGGQPGWVRGHTLFRTRVRLLGLREEGTGDLHASVSNC